MGILSFLFGSSTDRLRRTTSRYGRKGTFRKARGIDSTFRGKNGRFRKR